MKRYAAGIVIGLLILTNLSTGELFLRWRQEARALQKQNEHLDYQRRWAENSNEELKQAEQAELSSQAIVGVYECKAPYADRYQTLDLRSDGTGQFDQGFGERPKSVPWEKIDSTSLNVKSVGSFKIENGDLIDSKGNRWLHLR